MSIPIIVDFQYDKGGHLGEKEKYKGIWED